MLPEAHYTLAVRAYFYSWDWGEADGEFREALKLDPSFIEARFEYAWFLASTGRLREAVAEAQHAVERDPLSVSANLALGSIYSMARQDDQAIAQLRRTAELEPNDPRAYDFLSGLYESKGMYEEAIREHQKAMALGGAKTDELAGLRRAYEQSGAKGYWMWELSEAKGRRAPFAIAEVYARLGNATQAVAWLEKAYRGRDWRMQQLRTFREWDPIRSDPLFRALLRKMNFPT